MKSRICKYASSYKSEVICGSFSLSSTSCAFYSTAKAGIEVVIIKCGDNIYIINHLRGLDMTT